MRREDMMGGFFSLHVGGPYPFSYSESPYCAYLNSGRGALSCLLQHLPERPRRVLLPRFTCDTVLQPLLQANLPFTRYGVDEQLSPLLPDDTTEDDLLLLTQYFGLTGASIRRVAEEHSGPLIVDATTALYDDFTARNGSFYSPRKFAPLADGGLARAPFPLTLPQEEDRSTDRAIFLLRRLEDGAATLSPTASVQKPASPPFPGACLLSRAGCCEELTGKPPRSKGGKTTPFFTRPCRISTA